MGCQFRHPRYSWLPILACFSWSVFGAGSATLSQACQGKPKSKSTTVGSAPSGNDDGTTEHITIIEDQDDPEVWATVGSFSRYPSAENAAKAFEILDEVLADWSSHPPGVVTTILDEIAEHRLESGRKYLVLFAETDPQRPHAVHVIRGAARALGDFGGPGVFEKLAALAQDGPPDAASTVAVALGKLGDLRAVPVLEMLAQRPEAAVRQRALSALADYCVESSRALAMGSTKDPDHRVRNSATWWLAECGTPEHAALLASLAGDSDRLVRGNALKGLLRLRSKSACGSVPALLADESLTVQALARDYEAVCKAP